ncbi:MAG: hypothetical protein JNK21_08050, partial [Rhodospirillaceae bacterium]|nr:hypothetical protein [Rhodospirillaceae bacterium]
MTADAASAADAYRNGLAARAAGDLKGALSGFLMALALNPDEPAHRRAALDVLGVTSGYKTLPDAVLDALRRAASDPTLDLQPLSLVVKTLCENDARLAEMERALSGPAEDIEQRIAKGRWDWLL